jgi:hypothetical protein
LSGRLKAIDSTPFARSIRISIVIFISSNCWWECENGPQAGSLRTVLRTSTACREHRSGPDHNRSIMPAAPMPVPTHIVTMPYL